MTIAVVGVGFLRVGVLFGPVFLLGHDGFRWSGRLIEVAPCAFCPQAFHRGSCPWLPGSVGRTMSRVR